MKGIISVGAALAAVVGVQMISNAGENETLWKFVGVATLVATGCTAWGLWQRRSWALRLSWVLALGALILGMYGAHFAWTFWPFANPTLTDRIQSVLKPNVSLYWIASIGWLITFTRAGIRAQFARGEVGERKS